MFGGSKSNMHWSKCQHASASTLVTSASTWVTEMLSTYWLNYHVDMKCWLVYEGILIKGSNGIPCSHMLRKTLCWANCDIVNAHIYTVVKVHGATPKRWLSKGPWKTNTWELRHLLSRWYIYINKYKLKIYLYIYIYDQPSLRKSLLIPNWIWVANGSQGPQAHTTIHGGEGCCMQKSLHAAHLFFL